MTLILNGTDNSATTPAVTGTDPDTGVYYPAANQVALATNGTQAVLVDASQQVGIGVTPSINNISKSVDIQGGAGLFGYNAGFYLTANTYFNSGWKYKSTNPASYIYFDAAGSMVAGIAPSGSQDATATFSAVWEVKRDSSFALQGNTSKAGIGITFPATASLSSDANTLDDYEEGTFTPTVTGSISNPTIINPAFSAKYTRIGRQVTIHFYLQGGRTGGTGSGDLKIGNMPFPINTGDDGAGAVITYGVNCGASNTYVGVRRFDNTTVGLLGSNNLGGTWSYVQAGNLDTGLWALAAQYVYTTA